MLEKRRLLDLFLDDGVLCALWFADELGSEIRRRAAKLSLMRTLASNSVRLANQ